MTVFPVNHAIEGERGNWLKITSSSLLMIYTESRAWIKYLHLLLTSVKTLAKRMTLQRRH